MVQLNGWVGALESHIMAGGRLPGDRGEEVRDLQELLGFNRPDGVFGPMTMRQLTLAQGALGMTESGVVDLTTYAQLSDFIRSGRDIRASCSVRSARVRLWLPVVRTDSVQGSRRP